MKKALYKSGKIIIIINERMHATLHSILAKRREQTAESDVGLNYVLAGLRLNTCLSTGYSPYYLNFSRQVTLPVENLLRPRQTYLGQEFHKIALQEQHRSYVQVYKHLKKERKRQAQYHNRKAEPETFQVGDAVYCKNFKKSSKFDVKFCPYYVILRQLSPFSFIIKNQMDNTTIKVHASHLRKANINSWSLPQATNTRVVRKTRYVESPITTSSNDTDN